MILKKLLFLMAIMGLLILMSPSAAFAADDRSADWFDASTWGWIIAGAVVVLVLLVWGTVELFESNSPDKDAGEMFVDLPGLRTILLTGGNLPLDETLNYNFDWMLTDRREGRFWTATGMTFRFPYSIDGNFTDETELGGNIRMGFREGQWDYHLNVSAFALDDSEMMAWMTYRF